MLEGVDGFRLTGAEEEEVARPQLSEVRVQVDLGLDHAREQRHRHLPSHHRRHLECVLDLVRQPVDAGGDDVVDRLRECHVRPDQPGLADLDLDATRLAELPEDLLDVERVALAPVHEDVEQRCRYPLGVEKRLGHTADALGVQARHGDCLGERRGKPCHLVVGAAREEEQEPVPGKPRGQVLEELFRARVDPVDVFDHQDDRLGLARAEEHGPQHVEGALLELGTDSRRRNDSGAETPRKWATRIAGSSPSIPSASSRFATYARTSSPCSPSARPRYRRKSSRIGWYGIEAP